MCNDFMMCFYDLSQITTRNIFWPAQEAPVDFFLRPRSRIFSFRPKKISAPAKQDIFKIGAIVAVMLETECSNK